MPQVHGMYSNQLPMGLSSRMSSLYGLVGLSMLTLRLRRCLEGLATDCVLRFIHGTIPRVTQRAVTRNITAIATRASAGLCCPTVLPALVALVVPVQSPPTW